jgi:poly(beta-D-mannuronate) lyase
VQVNRLATSPGYANVALNKTATQSSTGFGGDASRAVDGNTSGNFGDGSVTHTNDTPGEPKFWEVDLGGDFYINEIALWNRTDCCGDRLSNFRLSVFDGAVEVFGTDNFTVAAGGSAKSIFSTFEDTGGFFARGDRVRVQLIDGMNNSAGTVNGQASLSLAEVQVFGVPEPSTALAALSGVAMLLVHRRRQ